MTTARSFLAPLLDTPPASLVLRNRRTGRPVATRIECAFDSATRRRGLLGRDSLPDDHAMVIAPCSSIHMFFMRFAIDVLFVKRGGEVKRAVRRIRPWRIALAPGAYAAIELPAGTIERTGTQIGDVLDVVSREASGRP